MLMYIEKHEYIEGLTQGQGMRLVIHPFNTMPFVAANGLSLAPGEETYIGIRLASCPDRHNIISVANPHSICSRWCSIKYAWIKIEKHIRVYPTLLNPSDLAHLIPGVSKLIIV